MDGPSFLGIGPPKTATTWLSSSFRIHPDVDMPPMKEIGYLWERSFLKNHTNINLIFSGHWFYHARRTYLIRALFRQTQNLFSAEFDREIFQWNLRYAFRPHSYQWYASLFKKGAISGDITPKYCELGIEDIKDFHKYFGSLKILLSVRDPVEREWSRAKMNLCKKNKMKPENVPYHKFIEHFNDPEQANANDYYSLYRRWSSVFSKENIHLIFFDEIKQDAWSCFRKICDFLDIPHLPVEYIDQINTPVNTGLPEKIPEVYKEYLFSMHRAKMIEFAEHFPEFTYPQHWLARYQTVQLTAG